MEMLMIITIALRWVFLLSLLIHITYELVSTLHDIDDVGGFFDAPQILRVRLMKWIFFYAGWFLL